MDRKACDAYVQLADLRQLIGITVALGWNVNSSICRPSDSVDVFNAISDQIHDMWFSIDALVIDTDTASMRLPLSDDKTGAIKTVLKCDDVNHVTVEDHENVGNYDINYLLLSKDRRKLYVNCNIPITIVVSLGPNWQLFLTAP